MSIFGIMYSTIFFFLLNLSILTNYVSIERVFSWLFITMKTIYFMMCGFI